jgi:diacylglycerol kinase family enzyme
MDPDAAIVLGATLRAPPIPHGAKALLLVNEMAGGVERADAEKLVGALHGAGIDEYALISAEHMSPALFARAADFDVIIVLGGDGTARAAAALAPRDGPPLILLPGGTLNILPRALYGERAWPEALAAALERGEVTRLTAGRANGEPFYVAALFGAPTLLARAREAMREGRPLRAWRRLGHAMERMFSRQLRARPDREPMRKAEAVGVLCPAFSGGISSDDLEWVRLDARPLIDLARVSLRALTAGWRTDSSIEIGRCRSSDIVSLGVIPATLDGEPRTFLSRVRVTYDPRGPRVVALPPEEG